MAGSRVYNFHQESVSMLKKVISSLGKRIIGQTHKLKLHSKFFWGTITNVHQKKEHVSIL